MRTETIGAKNGFRKVGPCLYRCRTGTYYGRFKSRGKEIRCSLETTDRRLAERTLARTRVQAPAVYTLDAGDTGCP
jgi:hypothetical protein